ncbi:unnamed protein product [Malus baccata var. baccata]
MKERANLAAAVTLFSALTPTCKRSVESAAGLLWCKFVAISFVVAMTMDPLFLYLLIIDQDNKCLGTDKKSWTVFLILRSLLDSIALVHLLYRLHLLYRPHVHFKVARERPLVFKYPGVAESAVFITSVIVDVLALLPFPLLVMGVAFYKICDYGSFRLLNLSIWCCVAQLLLRLFRIREDLGGIRSIGIWFKAMVYFYLYILFSHVFGAIWYYLSIQREMSCWYSACVNHNANPKRCIEAFYCDRRTITSRNITFLNEYCSIHISDDASSVPFNFGIYREALTSGITGHIYFFRRSFYCFWWGLRNISNFGTNLITSTYLPENVFVIFISMFSFLLVAIVGATASATASATPSATASSEPAGSSVKAEEKKKNDGMQRRKNLSENLESWNISGDLPVDLEIEILSSIDKIVEENEDADLKNDIFSILPAETRERLKRFLCMEILRTVPVLEMLGTKALEKICDYLKPVTYKENSFIFRMGDPLDFMLIIVKGTVCTYSWTSSTSATSSKMAAGLLGEGQFYGEDLLNSPDFTQLPISTEHVKTRGKVQAFALMADDLATVVANNCANNNCEEVEDDIVEIKHCAHSADVGGRV